MPASAVATRPPSSSWSSARRRRQVNPLVLVLALLASASPALGFPSTAPTSLSRPTTMTARASGSNSNGKDAAAEAAAERTIEVIMCRHGETDFNAANRCQGTSDVSRLTAKGRAQAAALGQAVAAEDRPIHRVFLSPLARARHTFDAMEARWRELGWTEGRYPTCAPTFLPDLQEIHLYSWQGHLREDLQRRHPDAFHNWYHRPDEFTVDGGFPVRELWQRARSAWATILSQAQPGERVLVVAHSGINQALCLAALGHGPSMYRRLNFVNCGALHLRVRLPPSPEQAAKLAHRGGYTLPVGRANQPQQQQEEVVMVESHYRVLHPADWTPEVHAPVITESAVPMSVPAAAPAPEVVGQR